MICILSDTHDRIALIRRALFLVTALSPDLVIHCGDITEASTLEEFAGLPMRFVFGNCDHGRRELNRCAHRFGFDEIAPTLELEWQGRQLFASHGFEGAVLREAVRSQRFDYVFHGHTHERRDETIGRTRVINPGALHAASPPGFAALDLETGRLEFVDVV